MPPEKDFAPPPLGPTQPTAIRPAVQTWRPQHPSPLTGTHSAIPRRVIIAVACEACRNRKVKCDGTRPRCTTCIRRNTNCEYQFEAHETRGKGLKRKVSELQNNQASYERIFDILRSRSRVEADAVLNQIRRGENVEDIARQIEYGDLLVQTSLKPEIRYRYDFPLSSHMPAYLSRQDNPYFGSIIYELAPAHLDKHGQYLSQAPPNAAWANWYAPYLIPYHAAEIIHPQLSAAMPSRWTTVCSDDALMRRLLASWFLQDHDWWTAFQKDYFLHDLAQMRHQLCSPLLVNAVLAVSCNYYRGLTQRTEFWNPRTLGYRFLAEARRLWEYELNESRLTTVQASLVLHIIYSGSGADKIGMAYMAQGCAMAHDMGLFTKRTLTGNSRLHRARAYTAWALFSWQSLMCFHYFYPPLVADPPEVALPDAAKDPDWYGEIWLKYPLNTMVHPSSSAEVFRAKAEFSVILNEAAHRLFAGASTAKPLSVTEAADFYFRFKDWYVKLPEALSPQRSVLPSHLKVHLHYFQIICRLLQSPQVVSLEATLNVADIFGQPPKQIATYAALCQETLLRLYFLRHGFECLDTYLVALLMESCTRAVDEVKLCHDPNELAGLQSTIILLAKGIYEQGGSFFLGKLVFQLIKGKMSAGDFSILERFIKIEPMTEEETMALQQVQMDWPVEVVNMEDSPDLKRLGNLIRRH